MENSIRLCKKCGFILGTRPNTTDVDGVCSACINNEKKKDINFSERQVWLTKYIAENKTNSEYDCAVGVSGGKDSTTIIKNLFENHGVKKILLINVTDSFSHTRAGQENLNNLVERFNCDLITFKINPKTLAEHMLQDFNESLNPLKYLEECLYFFPMKIAIQNNIKLLFYGENPSFEYGSAEDPEIFHPASTDNLKIIYLGVIYNYVAHEWYESAKQVGFKDLNYYNEWQRQGQIENYSQIDSLGYQMGIWTKFIKFGFQRVSDIACRQVRDGLLTYEQAQLLIKERDYICDSASMRDFCRTIGITEEYFNKMIDEFANTDLLVKDINGQWRRKDLL